MIVGGLTDLGMCFVLTSSRLNAVSTSKFLTIIAAVLLVAHALADIVLGTVGLVQRDRRSSMVFLNVIAWFPLAICVLQLFLSSVNGIVIAHFLIVAVCGIIFPLLFIFAARAKAY